MQLCVWKMLQFLGFVLRRAGTQSSVHLKRQPGGRLQSSQLRSAAALCLQCTAVLAENNANLPWEIAAMLGKERKKAGNQGGAYKTDCHTQPPLQAAAVPPHLQSLFMLKAICCLSERGDASALSGW
jgi:hypothetical protein